LTLTVVNSRLLPVTIGVSGAPGFTVPGSGSHALTLDPIAADHGWYDVTVSLTGQPSWRRRFAGHLENGLPSKTG
jgi:phospholipase C